MKIYSLQDKIRLKIANIEIAVSPLNTLQKAEIQGLIMKSLKDPSNMLPSIQASCLCIKYGLKELKGAKMADGSPFELQFEDGKLTDDCVEMLNNSQLSVKLHQTCFNLLNGIPTVWTDEHGEELKGVEVVKTRTKKKMKK